MIILPTIRQLQYLVALVETRHFGRAAERCLVTQSTLSAGLKDLEDHLRAVLVTRTKRRVEPTPLGLEIAGRARRLIADAEAIADLAGGGGEPLSGRVRLGVIPTIGPFLLPRVLSGLRLAYPDLKLFLREDLTAALLARLREGELEAALIALPHAVEDLEVLELGLDSFWFAARPDHPLIRARRRTISPRDIDREELLLLAEGHCLRDHALRAHGSVLGGGDPAYLGTSLYTLVEMVANGLGVTLLPEIAVSSEQIRGAEIAVKPLASSAESRRLALVHRQDFHRAADIAALAAYLKGRLAGLRMGRGKR